MGNVPHVEWNIFFRETGSCKKKINKESKNKKYPTYSQSRALARRITMSLDEEKRRDHYDTKFKRIQLVLIWQSENSNPFHGYSEIYLGCGVLDLLIMVMRATGSLSCC